MKERIARLRAEITGLRTLAGAADKKAAGELRALANDMEKTVSEMEQRVATMER